MTLSMEIQICPASAYQPVRNLKNSFWIPLWWWHVLFLLVVVHSSARTIITMPTCVVMSLLRKEQHLLPFEKVCASSFSIWVKLGAAGHSACSPLLR